MLPDERIAFERTKVPKGVLRTKEREGPLRIVPMSSSFPREAPSHSFAWSVAPLWAH